MAGVPQRWRPIEAIPPTVQRQRSPRLTALAQQWATEREALRAQGEETRLVEQMKNRMAIETGIIEGLYDIDRGVTETLIVEGFKGSLLAHSDTNQDPALVIAILRDQRAAIDYVFEIVKRQRPLSTSVVKELQAMLTDHQRTTSAMDQFGQLHQVQLMRGQWKQLPNNPTRPDGTVHEYCPPDQVSSEMDRLVDLSQQYEVIGVAPEVLAAWLHHRFTQIHPFQDGNGRVARLLATIVFLRAHWHPLVVLRDDRPEYITALEKADAGNLEPLIKLFGDWQSRAFVMALGASHAAEQAVRPELDNVLAALRDRLTNQVGPEQASTLDDVADKLVEVSVRVCTELAAQIEQTLRPALIALTATPGVSGPDAHQGYKSPRIALARASGFFADFTRGSRWARIMIRPGGETPGATLLVSTSALGSSQGSLAVLAGLITDDPATGRAHTDLICEETFVATVQDLATDESRAALEDNFSSWLTRCLVIGLAQWQKSLA